MLPSTVTEDLWVDFQGVNESKEKYSEIHRQGSKKDPASGTSLDVLNTFSVKAYRACKYLGVCSLS